MKKQNEPKFDKNIGVNLKNKLEIHTKPQIESDDMFK